MGATRSLASRIKITSALDYASGTATRNGAALDMMGYRGVLMVVKFAAIAASAADIVKAQHGDAANLSDGADLLASGQAVADDDDNQIWALEIWEPVKRYVRLVVAKDASNASAESAYYIQFGAKDLPTTLTVADLVTYKRLASPAAGTAGP